MKRNTVETDNYPSTEFDEFINQNKILITPEMEKQYLNRYPTIFDLHQAIKKKFGGLKP